MRNRTKHLMRHLRAFSAQYLAAGFTRGQVALLHKTLANWHTCFASNPPAIGQALRVIAGCMPRPWPYGGPGPGLAIVATLKTLNAANAAAGVNRNALALKLRAARAWPFIYSGGWAVCLTLPCCNQAQPPCGRVKATPAGWVCNACGQLTTHAAARAGVARMGATKRTSLAPYNINGGWPMQPNG